MELKISDLLRNIDRKEIDGVYILIGEEVYLARVVIDKLKETFEVKTLWGDEISVSDVVDAVSEGNIFSEKGGKVTLLRYADKFLKKLKKKEKEIFLSFLKKFKGNPFFMIYEYSVTKQDLSKDPLKTVLNLCNVVRIPRQSVQKIKETVKRKFIREGKSIDEEAIDLIIEFCGNDLMLLKQETDKLLLYAEEKNISTDDVKKVCSPFGSLTIFDFIDAFFTKDFEKALNMIKYFSLLGIIPLQVFYMLSGTAVKLFVAHNLLGEGGDIQEIFEILSIKHPYQKMKFQSYVKSLKKEDTESLLRILYICDRRIKINYEDPLKVLKEMLEDLLIKNFNYGVGSKFA